MNLKRVVITGLGTINPLGHNVPEFWDNLMKGVSGAGPITRFDASNFRTQFACEVKNYEPTEYFDKKEVRKMDLYTQFGIIAAREAIKDSGLDLEQENKRRIGVIWGLESVVCRLSLRNVIHFPKGTELRASTLSLYPR